MKTLLLLSLVALSLNINAQTRTRKTIATEVNFAVHETITGQDTMVYYYFSFKNMKYQHISDYGSILLHTKAQVIEMSEKLKELAEAEAKTVVTFTAKEYSLARYDFSNNIYLQDSKGKYTTLNKKQALKTSEGLLKYIDYLKD